MKTQLIFLVVLLLVVQSCTTAHKNVGHEYSVISRAEEIAGVPGAFESKAHHYDLYYRSLKLGTVGYFSIAPTGQYALFESEGKLMLFVSRSKQLRDETGGRFSVPKTVEWRENAGVVIVLFYDAPETRTIQL